MQKKYLEKFYSEIAKHKKYRTSPISLPLVLIYKTMNTANEHFLKEKYNLLTSHISVLSALYFNNTPLSPTELYDATIFSSGGMTKILKKLEELNYITREIPSNDKRSVLVTITPLGKQMTEEIFDQSILSKETIFASLDEEEKIELSRILKKVAFSLVK